jgi:hypothetical protein
MMVMIAIVVVTSGCNCCCNSDGIKVLDNGNGYEAVSTLIKKKLVMASGVSGGS